MDKFIITGGKKLMGSVEVSGAKNSSLALMPAALLNSGMNTLSNTPEVNDVYTMSNLLRQLGAKVDFTDHVVKIDTSGVDNQTAPYEHVKKMRASIYVLGPLLAKYGYAKVSLPGGCAWGPRPVNLHLEGMKKLGADIELEEGYIIAKAKKLEGARIHFDVSSVGATGNIMMAAALAKGTTVITNAAIEPEITQLAEYLVLMGAKINGINTSVIEIEGVDELKPADIYNIADRIEAGTLLVAGAMTRGKIKLTNVESAHLTAVLAKLEDSGAIIHAAERTIEIDATKMDEIKPVDVSTSIYPGFPTDMQAQWIAYMSLANGVSTITDNIYTDRFKHVPELIRLGANIDVLENSAVVKGVKELQAAKVMSTDLRASACLVLAALAASGASDILRIYHLDRGYQRIEEKLTSLGADIQRVEGPEY
ncbi:MAG TPA: UDP-N-acetylglucosamine 1-carboxyvinyltransferase [Ignavibacteriales bacterium]|nr:UDP-N-acetylglucosamine 1-carboxyvinyltransferase [Ignavibacteriales bacterium]